ncbi:uncharacterized protein LOC141629664 [Silene latifolia]|uniref:uncharacterized protein LOC141629664 n=1 Tax=Silene latifolia TaxID=37657 RepID=UPI003D7754D3
MMRQESGEMRVFTPGALSFMEALSHSIQKTRNRIVENDESLKEIQTQLAQDPLNGDLRHVEKTCAAELVELLKARNIFLSQKAKMAWMAERDENTAFFHSSIKRRRSQNRVHQVKDMNQKDYFSKEDIKHAFKEFYKSLLGESKAVAHVNQAIVKMSKCLTDEHRASLIAPISDIEVRKAMFDIHGTKTPDPDGYNS